MGKKDKEEKPICGTCLGAGGEWIELNGQRKKERKWVQCTACSGTGRR
jgi:DnaJ-class molecular chaperone